MSDSILQVLDALKQSQPIIFPTDTVYALACSASNELAAQTIFALKARPAHKALPLLVSSIAMAQSIAYVTPKALQWMETYWPGALTIILPLKENMIHDGLIAPSVLAGNHSVALRMPNHAQALELIKAHGQPLAATSVNRSGEQPAIDVASVTSFCRHTERANQSTPLIGACMMSSAALSGRASTIIDATILNPTIVRQGDCAPL